MEIDAVDIITTVGEFEKYLRECARSGTGEDVCPEAGRIIKKMDEGEESS